MIKFSDLPENDQVNHLRELQSSAGWKLLCEKIEDGEMAVAKLDLEEGTHENISEVKFLQYKISVCKQIMALPQVFIDAFEAALDKNKTVDVSVDDPYYTNIKDLDDANERALNGGEEEADPLQN